MSLYPPEINDRCREPKHAGQAGNANATGTGASFACGSFIRFNIRIDSVAKTLDEIRFETNGCGYMIAAAELLCEKLAYTALTELKGAKDSNLTKYISGKLGDFPTERIECRDVVFEAFHSGLANYREHVIEEFQGEKALICTCFGVSEETIFRVIEENQIDDVRDVSAISNAGSGCGSCLFLIREMIDSAKQEFR